MPVIDITPDPANLTITVRAEFAAPVERVWNAYSDPRQLERFWGPVGWPATFSTFDQRVGGRALYHMTSPKGEKSFASWEYLAIDAPQRFEVLDSFTDESGDALDGFPSMRMEFTFEPSDAGTLMTNTTHFPSLEALEQVVEMGVVEGTRSAMSQIDAALRDLREYAEGMGTQVEMIDDTHVRITRLVNGSRDLVWRAHHDPELMRQWLLGPDGWEMTDCVVATAAGDLHRTSWAPTEGVEGEAFGFEGEALLVDAPRRSVTTERMQGTEGPTTMNDLNLYEEDGATLITLVIEYPDLETRDMILATGMADGMEASYARLEGTVLAP